MLLNVFQSEWSFLFIIGPKMHMRRSGLIDCLGLEAVDRFGSRQLQRWRFVCIANADDISIGIVQVHIIAYVVIDIHIDVTMLNKLFQP